MHDFCACAENGQRSIPRPNDLHVIHRDPGELTLGKLTLNSTAMLPPDLRTKMDQVTRVDLELYRVALLNFVRETKHMERQLGRRVMCDDVLRRNEDELAYVYRNITALYYSVGSDNGGAH